MSDNMKIWDAVSKTNPKHTKTVTFGRKFTAIDAHYQIMLATQQFGPIGEGWGFDTLGTEMIGDFIMVRVSLWHGDRSNSFGPLLGCAQMFNVGKDKKADSDAPKKATTDAVTKGLSQLGFNADVFLGKFDDSKYVQDRAQEARKEEQASKPEPTRPELRDMLKAWMNAPKTTPEDVRKAWLSNDNFKAKLASLPQPMQLELKAEAERICPDLKEAA